MKRTHKSLPEMLITNLRPNLFFWYTVNKLYQKVEHKDGNIWKDCTDQNCCTNLSSDLLIKYHQI
jgi:hypothetical protein